MCLCVFLGLRRLGVSCVCEVYDVSVWRECVAVCKSCAGVGVGSVCGTVLA